MQRKKRSININLGFASLLGLVFITLKLTNQITWSWLWVLSPFWIPVSLILTLASVVGIVVFVGTKRGW